MATLSWLSKIPSWAWFLTAVAAGGVLWLRQHDATIRAETLAEESAKRADSLAIIVKRDSFELADRDKISAEQTALILQQQKEILAAGIKAQAVTNAAAQALREQLSVELIPLFDSVEAGYKKQIALKDEQIAAQLRITDLANQRIADRDSVIVGLRRLQASLEAEVVVANKRAKRSLLARAGEVAPWVIGAYVLGTRTGD